MIYMDNAATTSLKPEVFEKMKTYMLDNFANPASVYSFAGQAKKAVDQARDFIASSIHARNSEIYFTAGGSESDNWALKAVAEARADQGRHIITSKIEHHAVLHTCQWLERQGYQVTYLDVDKEGRISLEELKQAIRPDTILISIMFANNEVGTIQPVAEIGKIAHEKGILFHTDAVQAYGHIPIDVDAMEIDLLSASGHKFHGPKGVGFLYIKNGIQIGSFIHGGKQERARRAGTLNVPGIVGMGEAARLALDGMEENRKKQEKLRDYLIERVLEEIPHVQLNGSRRDRLPNNANFSFAYVEGESLLIMLDQKDIYASSGSACTSGSLDPSHVLIAMGQEEELAFGSLRLTLSEDNTRDEVDYVVNEIKKIVDRLRALSPFYEEE
ncbi:MAG: cysteine desulfurase NifS [Eubacterium sp.]|nr:cysteine desulfurase NifS [Eubacterium sp.]